MSSCPWPFAWGRLPCLVAPDRLPGGRLQCLVAPDRLPGDTITSSTLNTGKLYESLRKGMSTRRWPLGDIQQALSDGSQRLKMYHTGKHGFSPCWLWAFTSQSTHWSNMKTKSFHSCSNVSPLAPFYADPLQKRKQSFWGTISLLVDFSSWRRQSSLNRSMRKEAIPFNMTLCYDPNLAGRCLDLPVYIVPCLYVFRLSTYTTGRMSLLRRSAAFYRTWGLS